MFFVSFLCSAIPDLHLGILKMLIRLFFRITTRSLLICYLQVLAMYKKVVG